MNADTDICYSTNEEYYNYSDIEEAITDKLDECFSETKVGFQFFVWKGVPQRKKASDYLPNPLVETLNESAFDDAGEYCDVWPESSTEQDEELQQAVAQAVDAWADKHGLQPDFYLVGNVEKLTFEVTEMAEFSHEIKYKQVA